MDDITSGTEKSSRIREGSSHFLRGTTTISIPSGEYNKSEEDIVYSRQWSSSAIVRKGKATANVRLYNGHSLEARQNSALSEFLRTSGMIGETSTPVLSIIQDGSDLIGRGYEKKLFQIRSNPGTRTEISIAQNEHGLPGKIVTFENSQKVSSTTYEYSRMNGGWIVSRQEAAVFDSLGLEIVKTVTEVESSGVPPASPTAIDPALFIENFGPDVLTRTQTISSCETDDPRASCAAEIANMIGAKLTLLGSIVAGANPILIAGAAAFYVGAVIALEQCVNARVAYNEMCALGPLMYDSLWVEQYINAEFNDMISQCFAKAGTDPDLIISCTEIQNAGWKTYVI